MPLNKKAYTRYLIIDELLRCYKKRLKFSDLYRLLNEKLREHQGASFKISSRQLENDIKFMREEHPNGFGAPIKREKGLVFYTDEKYSMLHLPIDENLIPILEESIDLLETFESFEPIKNLLGFLLSWKQLSDTVRTHPIVEMESNINYTGYRHLNRLYRHIRNRKKIVLNYRPFYQETKSYHVHPYLLKEYNNRWFLIGWEDERQAYHNYALDRIQGIFDTPDPIRNEDFLPWHKKLEQVVGVSIPPDQKLTIVRFAVKAARSLYVETKPIHWTQVAIESNDQETIFSVEVIPNNELISTLLEYGSDLRVIGPESLVVQMKEITRTMAATYS